ncbi:MAG TPA: hypothetical protein VGC41_26820 [Kofleriaceae bacterium]
MVHVVFIDARSKETIGVTDIAPESLPETFELETQLSIAGKPWSVQSATPTTRAEYTRTGQLRIELAEIVMMDPRRILFSLPTIEDGQPALVAGDLGGGLNLDEDSWRQIELVDPKYQAAIDAERDEIHRVISERQGAAFPRLHVRKQIPSPLEIPDALPGKRRHLAISGMLVVDGFSIDNTIYGRSTNGVITELCATNAAAIAPFAQTYGLVLVDWTRD